MDIEEIPKGQRYEYMKVCDVCDMKQLVMTQDHNDPEYETYVYVMCRCGNWLEFILPVN